MNKCLFFVLFLLPILSFSQSFTESNLPIVVISTEGIEIPNEPKIPGTMKIIDNGPGMINHPDDPGNVYDGGIGIEIRGSFSASLPQKPYSIETRDALQNELDVSLFGWPEESDYVLLANYNDKVFMRNVLAFYLSNEMGHYASRTRFCEVVVNDQYKGIYVFGEKIKRDKGRVNIAKLEPDEISGEPLTGGYIFKCDYWTSSDSWQSPYHPIDHPDFDVRFVYYVPKPEDIVAQQKTYIKDFVSAYEQALYSDHFDDPAAGYRPYINTTSFVDYFIVNELARNNDGFKKSYYFFKDRDGIDKRINSGPVWDFDWAWKNIDECQIFAATDGSGWAHLVNDCWPDNNSPGWQVRLLQDTAFANETRCRWDLLRQDLLNSDSLHAWIDRNVALLQEAQERHYMRWPILGLNVGTPVIGPIPTTWEGEIADFKRWIDLRLAWLDANIPGTCWTTAVDDPEQSHALIFPNPTSDYAYIEWPNHAMVAAPELFNSNGEKVIVSSQMASGTARLDFSGLPQGFYLIRVSDASGKTQWLKISIIR